MYGLFEMQYLKLVHVWKMASTSNVQQIREQIDSHVTK